MKTIIGLGKAGVGIADQFSKYPQYNIFKIKVGPRKERSKTVFSIPKKQTPESYEKNCPSLKTFLKDVNGDVVFVVDGSGYVSAASLRIMQQLKDCQITVLYIKPDIQFLSDTYRLNERAVRGVLQEYARSAVFKRIYLVDVPLVAATLGDVPIKLFHERIYNAVVSSMHMINVFDHSEVVMGTRFAPMEVARISTFGFVDNEDGKENLFFALDFPREKNYYYGINGEKLQTDGTLLRKVNERVLAEAHDGLKTSYAVYETKYEDDYIYLTAHSSMVQP